MSHLALAVATVDVIEAIEEAIQLQTLAREFESSYSYRLADPAHTLLAE